MGEHHDLKTLKVLLWKKYLGIVTIFANFNLNVYNKN